MERKINFVYPNEVSKNIGVYPPLGIGYLAAYLSEKGYDVKVFDLTFEKDWTKKLSKKSEIYCITSTSTLHEMGLKAAADIKKINKKSIVIMGGPHPTILPKETGENDNIDFVVIGEGETTLYELCEAIINKKSFSRIKGIVYKKNNKIIRTVAREPIENLDELPFPRQNLFPLEKYFAQRNLKELSVITSRGCYGDCSYCQPCLRTLFGSKIRFRSAKNVVAEIKELKDKYDVDIIVFSDDTFGITEQTEEICKELIEQRVEVFWRCQARVNIKEGTLKLMKKAGCVAIAFGVESGDAGILKNIRKYIRIEDIKKVFAACRKIGIFTHAYLMIGNVGETKDSVFNTCKLLREIKPFSIEVHLTTPLPGTHLFDEAKKNNMLKEELKWSDLSYTENSTYLLDLPTLSQEEVIYYRNYIKKRFGKLGIMNRVTYIFRYLKDFDSLRRLLKFCIKKPRVVLSALKLMLLTLKSGVGVGFTNPSRIKELSVKNTSSG